MLGPALQLLAFLCSKQSAASVDFPQGEGCTDHRGTYSGSTRGFSWQILTAGLYICQPLVCLVKVTNTAVLVTILQTILQLLTILQDKGISSIPSMLIMFALLPCGPATPPPRGGVYYMYP